MKHLLLTLTLSITSILIFAQTTVKGIISDQATGEGLIGVNIGLDNKTGTVSDIDGSYELSLADGSYTITFSYLGYKTVERDLAINAEESITLDISMEEESEMLVITTVTSSKYERNITREAVSIEVIKPEFIERNATTDLSQVLERVPGVQIVDGQANIRSGSGFAYGAGSRVAIIVDDQPLLAGEFSDVKWNFIPIENAGQIEIIKGAASVLYGSGGLNGVINVRSAYPSSEPYTKATIYSGIYNISNKDGRRWYNQDSTSLNPFFTGVFLAHRQKIKNNFDLVLGANVHYDRNFLKTADEERYRLNINTRYRLPNNDNISMGINTNLMWHVKSDFFLWSDGYENAYTHIVDPVDNARYYSLTIDPYFTAFDRKGNKHNVKLRHFNIGRITSAGNAPAGIYSGDYQFQKNIEKHGIVMTTGISSQRVFAKSNLFNEPGDTSGPTKINPQRKIDISAAYFQIDKSFLDERLNLTFGTRIERFTDSNEGRSSTIPVFRGGVNYAASDKDFIRASFGQGYRIPSLAEKYINSDLTDDIKVLSNSGLKPEFGSSTEIGYKRAIGTKKGNWKGFVDISAFWMDYKDMTEFRFGLYLPDSILANGANIADTLIAVVNQEGLGFRMTNVDRARIAGFEVSAFGEGSFGRFPARFWTGYTYSYPGDLVGNPDQKNIGTYIKNLFSGIVLTADDPLAQNSILNFRALHTARFDMEMNVHQFTFGFAANYNGYMYDIDDFFKGEGLIEGLVVANSEDVSNIVESLDDFRSNRTKGDLVLDIRTSYNINDNHKVDFIINNIGNRQYAIRPLKMSPPMTINFKYGITL